MATMGGEMTVEWGDRRSISGADDMGKTKEIGREGEEIDSGGEGIEGRTR